MKLAVCLLGVIMTTMLIVPGRAAETWTNFGAGVRSCRAWTTSVGTRDRVEYEAWVFGFVSAFNRYGVLTDDNASKATDGRGMLAWIDKYCAAHPSQSIAVSADSLVFELIQGKAIR